MADEIQSSIDFWNNIHTFCPREEIITDNWLDQFSDIIKASTLPIIDLGCGGGNNTKTLVTMGKQVICCDQSINCINDIQKNFPEVTTRLMNMLDGFDFSDNSVEIVVADLSLHYFRMADTKRILAELQRILVPGGHIFLRVNTMDDVNHGAGVGEEIEPHLYLTKGGFLKRFFDEEDVRSVFDSFEIEFVEKQKMLRYKSDKNVFCVALKNTEAV